MTQMRPEGSLTNERGDSVFCTNCGAPIKEGNAFCTVCGTPVSGAKPKTTVPAAAPSTAHEPSAPASHLKIHMSEEAAPSPFFAAAGDLGADAAPPSAPVMPSEPPVLPRPAAPPPYVPPASAPAEIDTGGFVDSRPASAGGVIHPYAAFEASEERPGRKLWPVVLIAVSALLIVAAVVAWFFIPQVQDAILGKPEIRFEKEEITLKIGEKTDLNDIVHYERVDENKVRWQTDDEEHAIIKFRDGKVEAIGAGTCEIEVFSPKDDEISATIQITVEAPKQDSENG